MQDHTLGLKVDHDTCMTQIVLTTQLVVRRPYIGFTSNEEHTGLCVENVKPRTCV